MMLSKSAINVCRSVAITAALVLCVSPASADVYSYVDANGKVWLTNGSVKGKKNVKLLRRMPKKRNDKITGKFSAKASCGSHSKMAYKAKRYRSTVKKYARKYRVDVDLVNAVIRQESCFNPTAVSHAGASGLMQLMPGTAKMMGVRRIMDPNQNIRGGVRYLSRMLRRFDGNKKLALAAYNAGPGAVDKYNGIPPYRETQNYVVKIMAEYKRLKSS